MLTFLFLLGFWWNVLDLMFCITFNIFYWVNVNCLCKWQATAIKTEHEKRFLDLQQSLNQQKCKLFLQNAAEFIIQLRLSHNCGDLSHEEKWSTKGTSSAFSPGGQLSSLRHIHKHDTESKSTTALLWQRLCVNSGDEPPLFTLLSYPVHQMSPADEVWDSAWTSRILGGLLSEKRKGKEELLLGTYPVGCSEGLRELPVFAESVVIYSLGLHVWVEVFFFFDYAENERKSASTPP